MCWPADLAVPDSSSVGSGTFSNHKWHSISRSILLSSSYCPDKRRKIASHPSMLINRRLSLVLYPSSVNNSVHRSVCLDIYLQRRTHFVIFCWRSETHFCVLCCALKVRSTI